jgi:hypothetical protein
MNFFQPSWIYLENLYGKDVLENVCIEEIYFGKWKSPIEKGYLIYVIATLKRPPKNKLKNWNNAIGANIVLTFFGYFGFGYFNFSMRKLLKIKNKNAKILIKKIETSKNIMKIELKLYDCEMWFYAYQMSVGVSRIVIE